MKLLFPDNQEEEKKSSEHLFSTRKVDSQDLVQVDSEIYEARNQMIKECQTLTAQNHCHNQLSAGMDRNVFLNNH